MDRLAQLIDAPDEVAQPRVQPRFENFVDRGVAQASVEFGGHALGGAPGAAGQAGKDLVQFLDTGMQRAGHVDPQQQQLRYRPCTGRGAIEFVEGFVGGQRAQQRAPLVIATGGVIADLLGGLTEHFIACIEQAQGVVGSLQEGPQADETVRVVTHDGA